MDLESVCLSVCLSVITSYSFPFLSDSKLTQPLPQDTVHRTLNRIISRTFLAQFGLVLFDGRGFQLQREGDGQGRVAVLVKVDVKDSGVRRISWLHRRLSSNQLTGGWVTLLTQRGSRLGTLPQEQICSNSAKRLSIVKVQSDG